VSVSQNLSEIETIPGMTIARLEVDRALEEEDLVETVRVEAPWPPAQRLRDGLTEPERGRCSAALKS
jgi:hypothetical protein